TTLKNAYIMPAQLRDLAEEFLESQDKHFKVGLFQSKKKTNEAKEIRLQTFLHALIESMETTIQWKLREKTIELLQKYKLTSESLLQQVQQLTISFQKDDLFTFMKPGAMINGNYVLNYTNDLSHSIKNKYRQATNQLWALIEDEANQLWEQDKKEIEEALIPFQEQQEQLQKNQQMEERLRKKEDFIARQFKDPSYQEEEIKKLENALSLRLKVKIEQTPNKIIHATTNVDTEQVTQGKASQEYDSQTIVQSIEQVIDEISSMDGFTSIIQDLQDKQDRLSNRELTIALFGTFSAGKSSFSNALFGEKVLPVSPNPTTAVISRISPVSESHPHGKVLISLKSETELIEDLKTITKHLDTTANSFEEWINWIQQERIFEHSQLARTYQSYLEALLAGVEEQRAFLGQSIEISLDEF